MGLCSIILNMTVREYYTEHFNELEPDRKFHFATRIKNWFKTDEFNEYFSQNILSQDLHPIFKDNDFSKVNRADLRREYFEKYDHLFAIEAALFRVNHLKNEYNIDVRDKFLEKYPKEKLYKLSDDLIKDEDGLAVLSTYAVNVICLTEILFPRGINVPRQLAEISLKEECVDPTLAIYCDTHIILCDSNFYTQPTNPDNLEIFKKLIEKDARIINDDFNKLSLDILLEFLVCARMVNSDFPEIENKIMSECEKVLQTSPYLIDTKRPERYNTLSGAEHRNVLFIMSGLDK